MKVKDLMHALAESGKPDAEVLIQKSEGDGYFSLSGVDAVQPEGHIGASGFVIHQAPLPDNCQVGS